jgi:hypothetical protein
MMSGCRLAGGRPEEILTLIASSPQQRAKLGRARDHRRHGRTP